MVVTQIIGGGESEAHAASLHKAEYELLCLANDFKKRFDDYAKDNAVYGIPGKCL